MDPDGVDRRFGCDTEGNLYAKNDPEWLEYGNERTGNNSEQLLLYIAAIIFILVTDSTQRFQYIIM